MKRIQCLLILLLAFFNIGFFPMGQIEMVYAAGDSAFIAPDGGYYNVPTEGEDDSNSSSIYDSIKIPEESQKGEGFITKNFTQLIVDFINGAINLLGMHSIDQLARGTTHLFWGALDLGDVKFISAAIIPFLAIAWGVALVSGKVFALRLAHSTMNPRRKVKVHEFFENWFVGALLLTFGIQLVNLIFQISSVFTDTFLSGIPGGTFDPIHFATFNATKPGTGLMIGLYSLAVVGITFALNLMYLQRYVMLAVYASLSPFYFMMYFFDTTRGIFWNWVKTLATLAFMPAAHSFLMWLYTLASYTQETNYLLRLVFLMLFISITETILKLTGLSAGTGGMSDHILTGLGLGITMSGMRGLGGMFAAFGNGGNPGAADMAIATMGMMGQQDHSGISKPGSMLGNGVSATNTSGALSGANSTLTRTRAAIDTAKNLGSKMGSIVGGVGGAVMGAATGNVGMMALGGTVGSTAGSKAVGTATAKATGVAAVQGQILGQQISSAKSQGLSNMVSRAEAKENLFGAGASLPEGLEPYRQQITDANVTGLQGAIIPQGLSQALSHVPLVGNKIGSAMDQAPGWLAGNHNRMNQNLSSAMASALPNYSNITPQEGDRAFSRAFADHTEFYYQPKGQSPILMDYTTEGDRMAGMNRAVETVQEYRGKKNPQGSMDYSWQDVHRQSVDFSSSLGSPGVPWTWNTRKSIMREA